MDFKQHAKGCVIIPGYMEEGRVGRVVAAVRAICSDVVVIDDGSRDKTSAEAEAAGAVVLRHEVNKGKGVSLDDGFKYAREHGFEFVITMDADGQHEPADLPRFISEYAKSRHSVLVGNRMADPAGMPLVRRWTNSFMSWLLSRKMGQRVPDTQCGYRLYRCDIIAGLSLESTRFAAESEVLLCLADKGVLIGSVPVTVIYRDETSKINPVRDAVRFFQMMRNHGKKRLRG